MAYGFNIFGILGIFLVAGIIFLLWSLSNAKQTSLATIVWYMVCALPIPISIFSWMVTTISFTAFAMFEGLIFERMIFLGILILVKTYLITYMISLFLTIKLNKKFFSAPMLLPVLHIALFVLFIVFAISWEIFA